MTVPNSQPPAYFPPSAGHINAFPAHLHRTASRASTILPQYSAGGQITPTGTNATPNILSIKLHKPAYYDIGDVIHGDLIFSPRKQTELTTIGISFSGEEVTTKSGWTSDKVVKRSFGISHHIVPQDALPQDDIFYPGYTYTYPFSMVVPDLIPLSEGSCCKEGVPIHYRLPPSLGSPPQSPESIHDVPNNAARITYSLKAFAKAPPSKNQISSFVSQYLKYIRICPSYTPSPESLSPRLVKNQFQGNIKKGILKRTTSGNVSAKVTEGPVLGLNGTYSSTSVPIKVTFTAPSSAPTPPPKILKVSMNILAVTTYSTNRPLSASNEEDDNTPSTIEDHLHVATQKIASFQLDPVHFQSTWDLDPTALNSYFTTLVLPVTLLKNRDWLPPTFESCYISRKYVVDISIHIAGGQLVSVEAPLIILSSLVSRSNMPFDLEPHQYQSPVIAAASSSRKNGPSSVVLDRIPGLSLDALLLSSSSLSLNSNKVSLVSEQERLAKTPVVR